MGDLIRRLLCVFGNHAPTVGRFKLHDYVNSALDNKRFRYESWDACPVCEKRIPRKPPVLVRLDATAAPPEKVDTYRLS